MDRQLCRWGLGQGGAPHRTWTSGPPSSGKSAPSLTPPPPADLPRSAWTAPARTDCDGARRCWHLTFERPMWSARWRAAGWIRGGCWRASGLGAGGEVVACLAASPASTDRPSGALMKRCSWLNLAAAPAHRATRCTGGRVYPGAIRCRYPRKTAAAPCPRGALHPRALAAARGQLEGARAQVAHAEQRHEVNRQALSIRLAWACAARSAHM